LVEVIGGYDAYGNLSFFIQSCKSRDSGVRSQESGVNIRVITVLPVPPQVVVALCATFLATEATECTEGVSGNAPARNSLNLSMPFFRNFTYWIDKRKWKYYFLMVSLVMAGE